MTSKFAVSKREGPHLFFAEMAGEWEGITRVWFEPEVLGDESACRGSIRLILDGRFALHEYEGMLNGEKLTGLAIIGCHVSTGEYQIAWVDSFHNGTAIMFSTGDQKKEGISVLGSYGDKDPATRWGWRTTLEMPDKNSLIITAYNITPEGEEAKAVETAYRRV